MHDPTPCFPGDHRCCAGDRGADGDLRASIRSELAEIAKLTGAELSKKVEYLGSAALTGGLIMDADGTLYGGDLEHSTVVALTLAPDHKLSSKVFVSDPSKLSWADGFAISGGTLYIADSHLWELAFKNSRPRSGPFTIFKVKLPH